MPVASIDIGSNSIILLIAHKAKDGTWERIEEHTDVARISEGLDTRGTLQPAAVERATAVLRRFVDRARAHSVDALLMTGTAPFRRAENGQAVARALAEACGVPLTIVSGEEEGELTLRATLDSFPAFDAMHVLDIGGASTELMRWNPQELQSRSVDIGVVRLLERFVTQDPPTVHALDALRQAVRETLQEAFMPAQPPLPVVGVGGTITSLAALDLGLETWDPDAVQGHRLHVDRIRALGEKLWPMRVQERCDSLGVDPRRADVIAVGAWFLHAMCERLGVSEMIVSDRGLRWGRIFTWDEEQRGR